MLLYLGLLHTVEVQHLARFSVFELHDALLTQILTTIFAYLIATLCRSVTKHN